MNENEAFIRRWFEEVWNDKNESMIDEMLADDVIGYGLVTADGGAIDSKATFKQLYQGFVGAFPDIKFHVDETMSNDERAMARFTVTGTHAGDGLGIPPTGSPINFNGTLTIEVKDGKMTKAWNDVNFLLMYQQLGAVTMSAPGAANDAADEAVMRRWFEEVWNQGREEVIDELFPDGVAYGLGDGPVHGAEGYKPLFRSLRGAFPDVKVTVEDAISAGGKVAMRCRMSGTHDGEGLGKRPTNKPVEIEFNFFATIKDGKIAEAWNVVDFMKMYSQIDALDLRLDDQK